MHRVPKSRWRPISRDEAANWSALAREMLGGQSTVPAAVTGQQVRAARVGLGISLAGLAARADVSEGRVELFEQHDKADRFERANIVASLEAAGVAFVTDAGVRLVAFRASPA